MQEGLDYYASFFEEKISPTDLAPGALESGFIDGSIGSFISGPWHMGILRDQGGEEFNDKWSVAPMPTEDAGTSFTGGSDWVVFKDAKNRDTAWKFVDFLDPGRRSSRSCTSWSAACPPSRAPGSPASCRPTRC